MPRIRPVLLALAASCAVSAPAPGADSPGGAGRTVVPLADGWRFQMGDAAGAAASDFDDAAWPAVTVPHNFHERGVAWYRRPLSVDPELAGRHFYVEFGAASLTADVYLDGRPAGAHRGGFTTFRVPVPLKPGTRHVLAVRVNSEHQGDIPCWGDYTVFGGLYRPVRLLAVGRVALDLLDHGGPGAYATTSRAGPESAVLRLALRLRKHGADPARAEVTATLADASGGPVAKETAVVELSEAVASRDLSLTVAAPRLWQGRADPYLYRLTVAVSVDGRPTDTWEHPVGIRTVAVDPDKGFLLNGRVYDLRGVCAHQEIGAGVWAVTPRDVDRDLATLIEMGCTGVRLVHYPHGEYTYAACDRLGLVVWTETPMNVKITPTSAYAACALQHLREMIRQTADHPSVGVLSMGNEVRLGKGSDPTALLAEMIAAARREAPGRILTLAAKGGDPLDAGLDAIGYNSYRGWYGGEPADIRKYLDDRRREHPGFPIGLGEYGAGCSITQHALKPKRMDYTEEWQSYLHEVHWQAMKERPWLWCKFVWLGFDSSSSRKESDTPGQNNKGLVTRDRKTRKDAYYWYKANWSAEPFVYITSRRFAVRDQAEAPVKVYSNCPEVELFHNGKSLGARRAEEHLFLWPDVTLAPGANKLEAVARRGDERYTDGCEWTLAPPTSP